jgi:hypothetical protein
MPKVIACSRFWLKRLKPTYKWVSCTNQRYKGMGGWVARADEASARQKVAKIKPGSCLCGNTGERLAFYWTGAVLSSGRDWPWGHGLNMDRLTTIKPNIIYQCKNLATILIPYYAISFRPKVGTFSACLRVRVPEAMNELTCHAAGGRHESDDVLPIEGVAVL